ncbi:hypothetical protein E2C01_069142 [Portunus trituberculatus]|uniref:Uncharacterized protein n=1 Tax=Portunus trituberculatus TaxID=210409 RepID=A0A5B7HZU0_PORTR|nr:hypothetical protein [Portunus trituberculatus]
MRRQCVETPATLIQPGFSWRMTGARRQRQGGTIHTWV